VLLAEDTRLRRGDPDFTRVGVAMFAAGAAIFALLYSVQALLPQISADFDVSPATAGLTMSVTTAALALAIVPASALSEQWGRSRVLICAVTAAAVFGALQPFSPTFGILLMVRALQGVAMAGMPAVAMAYLADEIHPSALAGAVGTFVAGNGIGGLSGRILGGVISDVGGWRWGLGAVSLLSALCAAAFVALLRGLPAHPPSRSLGDGVRVHLRDPLLRRLFVAGFVLMGGFVTVYNYLGYRLLRPPFGLPPAAVGLIFLAYLAGTAASALAGRLADARGARVVLIGSVLVAIAAILLTVPDVLLTVLAGLVLVTVGFFAAHAVASGWVSRRAATARGQAAGVYLFAYYLGSSVGGWIGGLVFERGGWTTTALYVTAMFAVALLPTLRVPVRSASVVEPVSG
jgi:MFS transporter, YNFM family, putative membrane transport protein